MMKMSLGFMGILQGIILAMLSFGCEEVDIRVLIEHRHGDDDSDIIIKNETDSACYSPTQNWGSAYNEGAYGCDCDHDNKGVCIGSAALICNSGQWVAVEDGPCMPTVEDCVIVDSLDSCLDRYMNCEVDEDGSVCGR